MKIAERLHSITPSITLAIDTKAKQLKAQGADLCNFTVGEPDFPTPPHIVKAAQNALDQGKTRYGAVAGELVLRKAIAEKLQRENNLPYQKENIVVTNGGKHALFNTILALINPGDEVIIPAPYWLSYPEMVKLAGGTPIILETTPSQQFKVTPEQLQAAITPKTKLFILNSPSNPTGMLYNKKELLALAETLVKNNLWVISDEIYEKLVYDEEKHVSIGTLSKEIFAQTITCNGFAKAYAMTGWRLGYVAAPPEIARAIESIQGHSTSNVCTFAQYGALEALQGDQSTIEHMRKTFETRRNLIYQLIQEMPKVSCLKPQGAFYMFMDIRATGLNSVDFCAKLLDEEQVAAVPGAAFGAEGYVRFSYATDLDTIRKGMERLQRFLRRL